MIKRSPLPLRGSVQFQDVFSNADSRQHSKDVLVLVKKNSCTRHRIGLITSKKKLRRAVDRNRFRRIARASLQTLDTNTGLDVIFMAKAPIADLHQATCSHRMGQQLLKAVSKATPKAQ